MPIEHINKTDTLNEGREKLNAAIDGANSADVTSKEADTKATQALANSESTQTQLDTIVIDGDSSVEAAQARVDEKGVPHPTLKARIDDGMNSVNQQLAETVDELRRNGVNPITFGAVADGVNDDSDAIEDAIEFISMHGGSLIASGTEKFKITKEMTIDKPLKIMFNGASIVPGNDLAKFKINSDDCTFDSIHFDLRYTSNSESKVVVADNRKNITLNNCSFEKGYYGVFLEECENVWITNNKGSESLRWHIYVLGGKNIFINNNKMSHGQYDGIKVGGKQTGDEEVFTENIIVSNNICYGNERDGIDMAVNSAKNVKVNNNILYDNKLKGIEIKFAAHDNELLKFKFSGIRVNDNDITTKENEPLSQGILIAGWDYGDNGKKKLSNVVIDNNVVNTSSSNLINQTGIGVDRARDVYVSNNKIFGETSSHGGIRIIETHGTTLVKDNFVKTRGNCVLVEGVSNDTVGIVIRDNELESLESSGISLGEGVINPVIINNKIEVNPSSYSVNAYSSTNPYVSNTLRGFTQSRPANQRGTFGDVFLNSSPTNESYIGWMALERGSKIIWYGYGKIE